MIRRLALLYLVCCGGNTQAVPHASKAVKDLPVKTTEEQVDASEFRIDSRLLENIYDSETQAVRSETLEKTANVEMGIQASLLNATALELNTNYFTIRYQDGTPRIPMAYLTATTSLIRPFYWLDLQAQGKVGYSDVEGVFPVRSQSGLELTDVVKLHWLPLSAGLRFRFFPEAVYWAQPSIAAGIGAQFLNQEGQLDGMNQNFWVPFYYISPALTFFRGAGSGNWFGGVTAGVTVNSNLSSSNRIQLWSADLSISLLL